MYYHVTSMKDADKLYRKYKGTTPVDRLTDIVYWALKEYPTGDAAVSISHSLGLEYCRLAFYKAREPRYGTRGYFCKNLKYNKELVCVK